MSKISSWGLPWYVLMLGALLGSLLPGVIHGVQDEPANQPEVVREAYAALFYGQDEGFLLGMRVLGQSLKESGSTRDMVALCLPDVSKDVRVLLSREGWIIYPVNPKEINYNGPYQGHVAKLAVLTLIQYHKIVLIDTDVIAYEHADDIFNCGNYCATMRHSNMFNSGVMVLTPSQDHFVRILKMLQTWDPMQHSHKGGDQDILNVYFNKIHIAPVFNKSDPKYTPTTYAQLPYEFNMDVGMYYLRDEWLIERRDYRFLHYTLGDIRPWQWLTYPLFELNHEWQEIRFRLKEPTREMFTPLSRYLPFYSIVFIFFLRLTTFNALHRLIAVRATSSDVTSPNSNKKCIIPKVFPIFYRFCKCIIFSGIFLSIFVAIFTVPMHVRPFLGWAMFIFSFTVLLAHVFEFTFIICHYGSGQLDRLHRTFRIHSLHTKFVLLTALYLVLSVSLVLQIQVFSTRCKVAIFLAILFLAYLNFSIDYMLRVYIQYLPHVSPLASPKCFRKSLPSGFQV